MDIGPIGMQDYRVPYGLLLAPTTAVAVESHVSQSAENVRRKFRSKPGGIKFVHLFPSRIQLR